MKKVIAFDLDDTLTITKSPIDSRMVGLLLKLAQHFQILIITGGSFDQIKNHVLKHLKSAPDVLTRFHLMPTCGTQYYRYNQQSGEWQRQYAELLATEERERITQITEKTAKQLGYWESNPAGAIIEDRESQITFSPLGQDASPEAKAAWDPDFTKRQSLREAVARELPGYEVRIDGRTSLNITREGIDKGYGMRKLQDALGIDTSNILFIGDRLEEGGNDYPVKAVGIDTIAVTGPDDTVVIIEGILADNAAHQGKRSE